MIPLWNRTLWADRIWEDYFLERLLLDPNFDPNGFWVIEEGNEYYHRQEFARYIKYLLEVLKGDNLDESACAKIMGGNAKVFLTYKGRIMDNAEREKLEWARTKPIEVVREKIGIERMLLIQPCGLIRQELRSSYPKS